MLKLWKVNAKAGDATVKYPFAPFPTNKDMRGKPEHNAELCIACGACGVACPADAIRMDTDLAADTITWSIDYGLHLLRPLRGSLPHGGHQAHRGV